ncbi:MAG TPA: flagellar hook-length control protein FliK, partial [Saliniramus sp.]|nr:flagellar hook-length control protein FliK [Saliniramus sp.]
GDHREPAAEEQGSKTASGPAAIAMGEPADAAAAVAASLLAGANAGAVDAGRGRRSDSGPGRSGVAPGSGSVAPKGSPDTTKQGAVPAQASPVAAANAPLAAAATPDAPAVGETAQDASAPAASPEVAVETGDQARPTQPIDNPGLRRALGQLGMTPGQGGAIPVPAVVAGEPGATGPGAQQGLAQALSGLAEAAGKPAPMVPPAPVVPNVPLGAVPIEIGMKAMAGVNHFQIRLDPAELGRIDVNLEIDTDGTVKARLTVDRVETLTLLQRDARTLERAFEQAGLKPSDGGVDLSLRDQGRNDRGGSSENGRENGRGGHSPAHENAGGSTVAKPVEPAAVHRTIWRGAAGIDVRI